MLFDQGTEIGTGSHGEHSLLYANGEPVLDAGESTLAFEQGTGLGGATTHPFSLRVSVGDNQIGEDAGSPETAESVTGGEELHGVGFGGMLSSSTEHIVSPLTVSGATIEDWADFSNWGTQSGDVYVSSNTLRHFEFALYDDQLNEHFLPGDTLAFDVTVPDISGDFYLQFAFDLYFASGDFTVRVVYQYGGSNGSLRVAITLHDRDASSTQMALVTDSGSATDLAGTVYQIDVEWDDAVWSNLLSD